MNGVVFDIVEMSVHDGPGIRATVFLKGCPLRCTWCHNPEGQSRLPQILKNPRLCSACGECVRGGCSHPGCISVNDGRCLYACPNSTLRLCGAEYSPEQLTERLLRLEPVLRENAGGVTFSGGEPLAQPEFLCGTLDLLKGRLHTAIQTSGYCSGEDFMRAAYKTDLILFDLKPIDEEQHRRYTGVSNGIIHRNLAWLTSAGIPFIVRTVMIPGVTDTAKNITALAGLLTGSPALERLELLPCNPASGGKYSMCGMEYTPGFDADAAPAIRAEILNASGIRWGVM